MTVETPGHPDMLLLYRSDYATVCAVCDLPDEMAGFAVWREPRDKAATVPLCRRCFDGIVTLRFAADPTEDPGTGAADPRT